MKEPAHPRLREVLHREVGRAILRAAEQVISRGGVANASMQAIAQEAGVAVGTLYNHHGDRGGLLRALLVHHRQELTAAIAAAEEATRGAGFRSQAERFAEAVLNLFDQRRGFVRAAFESELWRALSVASIDEVPLRGEQQLIGRARALVQVGLDEGTLKAGAPDRLAAVLAGAVRSVLLVRAQSDEASATMPPAGEAAQILSWFLFGASARQDELGEAPSTERNA